MSKSQVHVSPKNGWDYLLRDGADLSGNMLDHRKMHERIQTLKQEIDGIQQLNELYWDGNLPSAFARFEHERCRERLQQIRDELKSLVVRDAVR